MRNNTNTSSNESKARAVKGLMAKKRRNGVFKLLSISHVKTYFFPYSVKLRTHQKMGGGMAKSKNGYKKRVQKRTSRNTSSKVKLLLSQTA